MKLTFSCWIHPLFLPEKQVPRPFHIVLPFKTALQRPGRWSPFSLMVALQSEGHCGCTARDMRCIEVPTLEGNLVRNVNVDETAFYTQKRVVPIHGGTPRSSILIGFSIIKHQVWGSPILGNHHVEVSWNRGKKTPKMEWCISWKKMIKMGWFWCPHFWETSIYTWLMLNRGSPKVVSRSGIYHVCYGGQQ